MIYILIFSLCGLTAGASLSQVYSFSQAVGRGAGDSFAITGEGRITGVRVWEMKNADIRGLQLKYGNSWTDVIGTTSTVQQEMLLFDDEAIVQISGKYNPANYIFQLIFITNRGRFFTAGQPAFTSFNFYPTYELSELRMISGRSDTNGITAIAAHWGTPLLVPSSENGSILAP